MQKLLVALALLFVCGTVWALPAPAALEPAVAAEPAVEAVPSDLFDVAVIDRPAECVTGKTAARSAELCGVCSDPVCVGQPVVLHVCGRQGTQWLRCHDMGFICHDSSPVCGCNNGIIP